MAITREIDQMAQKIFGMSIIPSWLIREQHPDIHIDYVVELADDSGPLGNIFGVQLKGTISPKYSGKYIKYSLKTRHIAYYLDKVKYPVFLVVIDVRGKIGYYYFVQEWSKKLINSDWRKQDKIILKIPTDNSITNIDKFKNAILQAENYMRDLRPSSIPVAINYERDRLKNIDPRFEVNISHYDGKTNYSLQAKEPVNFTFHFKKPEQLIKKFIDFSDRGLPLSFDTTDILKVEGSDLLKEAFEKRLPGKFTIERKYESTMRISTLNKLNQATSMLYEVKGIMSGGTKEIRFEGAINETPFRITMILQLTNWTITQSPHFEIEFNEYTDWEGRPIILLPFFENLLAFFNAIKDGDNIKIICEIKGIRVLEGKSGPTNSELANHIFEYLNLIQKARVIANSLNADIIFPKLESISKQDVEHIELIYDLVEKAEHRQNGSNAKIKGKITPNEEFYELIGKEAMEKDWEKPFMIEIQEPKYIIFGKEICLWPLRITLTNPKIIVHKNNTKEDMADDSRDLQLIGTKNSELIVSRI